MGEKIKNFFRDWRKVTIFVLMVGPWIVVVTTKFLFPSFSLESFIPARLKLISDLLLFISFPFLIISWFIAVLMGFPPAAGLSKAEEKFGALISILIYIPIAFLLSNLVVRTWDKIFSFFSKKTARIIKLILLASLLSIIISSFIYPFL